MTTDTDNPLSLLKAGLANWSNKGIANGWLSADSAPGVPESDERSPSSLFGATERPLVVAFFGGTGVGKSSLLNRLAGEAVARSSVERPTSREITLYIHESVHMERLPEEFPIEKIRQSVHRNETHRSILWIDMPDFDSAETANRDLVDQWLPHIDLLVYVVNPERYRDDSGWRLLLKNAKRHAWVFVINHWDRSAPGQREDFQSILDEAGLSQPLLFCTDCGPDPEKPNGDEFSQFEQAILELSNQRVIQQLEEHGVLVRVEAARQRLQSAVNKLESIPPVNTTAQNWQQSWQQQNTQLLGSMNWKFKLLAQPFKQQDTGFMTQVVRTLLRRPAANLPAPRIDAGELIDETFQDSVQLGLDQAIQKTVASGVPVAAARNAVKPLSTEQQLRAQEVLQLEIEKSLAEPGTAVQRAAYKTLGLLALFLPLAVFAWAVYKLLVSYQSGQQYLGFNFATHTLLLAGLAWLIPFLLRHFIRPTAEAAARRGMKIGLGNYLDEIGKDTESRLTTLEQQRSDLISDAERVFDVLPDNIRQAANSSHEPRQTTIGSDVNRVLVSQ